MDVCVGVLSQMRRSPAPQPAHHHPPSPLRFVSVRLQQSPSRRGFTTEMAAKVCRSVLLLSRSSGAVAGSLPALVVSSQRHHQHIRPVSPRTSVSTERGVGLGRQAGPGEKAALASALAKEVKLTSLKNLPFMSFIELALHEKGDAHNES
ncbi:hypothetical protein Q8A73_001503 [Channa argus]|nr:hypothetical protein Q8A73_001503 [Channa argus]